MPITGRPKPALVITDDERDALIRLTKRPRANRLLAFRARLVLACADGATNTAVARRYHTTDATVGKWRQRFIDRRLDGIYDERRVGAPPTISDEDVETVIVKTLETTRAGETHWSTRTMAATAGMSHTTIGRIWRTFGLKPHVTESFKISPDPQLIEKVQDVVGLYMNPPTNAAAFSFDEKSQIQALERAQPILPMDIGQPERRTHNYIRNGTLDLFAALNVATGEVLARCKPRHRAPDFVAFLREIEASVDPALEVHVVLDNLSAHRAPVVHRWLLRHPSLPSALHANVRVVAQSRGAVLRHAHREGMRRGSHTSVPQLREAILAYVKAHNAKGKPFTWTKTPDEILDKIRRLVFALNRCVGSDQTFVRNHRSRGLGSQAVAIPIAST